MYLADNETAIPPRKAAAQAVCYHCGTACYTDKICVGDKVFCCDGCKTVFELLSDKGLCNYYELQSHPGLSQIKGVRNEKFAYLDEEAIAGQLCSFRSATHCVVTFYLPAIHCSSCMWLLEHLSRVDPAITESRINFSAKEITVRFVPSGISLRKVAELLTTLGYEPYISLTDVDEKTVNTGNRQRIIKLGIAGFCFGNIMMLSFPEYFSGIGELGQGFTGMFRYLNLALSLPVFF